MVVRLTDPHSLYMPSAWQVCALLSIYSSRLLLPSVMRAAGFAVVKLGTDRNTGEEFAIKIMALPEVGRQTGDNENTREDIFKEIDILVGMEHENVIFMKEYFEENNKVSSCSDNCHPS